MDVNEMLWTPHGSLSIRWEHGEPYHEAYGGIVPYEDLLGLCIEYRSGGEEPGSGTLHP